MSQEPTKPESEEVRRARVMEDPEYVDVRRFDFNATKLMARYEDGCPDHVIASALMIPEEEVETQYQLIVDKMRDHIGVDDE